MRCDECGRPIKNAQMWQLGGSPKAPQSRSFRQLCWDCLERERQASEQQPAPVILAQADEVLRQYQADQG